MGGGQQGCRLRRNPLCRQHALHYGNRRLVGEVRVLAALEHAGVSAFETKRENVQRDVGARFINDAYHAERHRHLAKAEAVGQRAVKQDAAERRRQRGHVAHIRGDGLDAGLGEHQAVVERRAPVHPDKVLFIGAEEFRHGGLQLVGNSQQYGVAGGIVHGGEALARLPGIYEVFFQHSIAN